MFKIIVLVSLVITALNAEAVTRIKDIAMVEGVRENLLVGQGLVVGLNGTGDNLQNTFFTKKSLTDFLERLGINTQGATLRTRNIAAVTITGSLPAFARQGSRIDVKVSALGDARSLRGGTLLASPMRGADGNVYAVAQGSVALTDFFPASAEVKTKNQSVDTNGYIQGGGIVEDRIDFKLSDFRHINFSLYSADFNTAISVANVINNHISGNNALALDAATIQVTLPAYRQKDMVEFIAEIERLQVTPDYKAKIVINEATGTVVIGDKVTIRPVAIAQGNLVVNIGQLNYDRFSPLAAENRQDRVSKFVDERRGRSMSTLDESATLSELVSGLNKLGVWPRDIINILHNMKAVGALDAIIEVK